MSDGVQEWLPPEAAAQERVQGKIRLAVADWSARWFVNRRLASGPPRSLQDGPAGEAPPWMLHGSAVALSLGRRSANRLLGWALDVDFDYLAQSDVDRDLLQAFEHRMLGDLIGAIEDALGLARGANVSPRTTSSPFGRLGGVQVPLLDDRGDELAMLALPLEPILSLCRSPSAAFAKRPPLDPIVAGFGETAVRIRADLGQSTISLAELRGLAPGDVLVFDRQLVEGVRVSVADSDHAFARAEIISDAGFLALALHS